MNIKDYYIQLLEKYGPALTDGEREVVFETYSYEEIYTSIKNLTSWKLLVLNVRITELYMSLPTIVQGLIRFTHRVVFWRKFELVHPEYVDLVNEWEK